MCNNMENGHDYVYAKDKYASYGVDTEKAIEKLAGITLSIHCWQGDDVVGLESDGELTGGIAVTGNYMGKARKRAGAACRYRQSLFADTRQKEAQPSCNVCRV